MMVKMASAAQFGSLWMIAFGNVRRDAFENELADKVCYGICADVG